MGREARRVPLDFDWPIKKTWQGYLMPESLRETPCPDCTSGYAPYAQHLYDQWYGKAPFDPADTGSTPYTVATPEVRAFAERNVAQAPWYYGGGEAAIVREAQRLAGLYNGALSHHLTQEDVDALLAGGRLVNFTHRFVRGAGWQPIEPAPHPTAAEVNAWSLNPLAHDDINRHIVIQARCEREGVPSTCPTCNGHASVEKYPGQHAEAEAWQATDPPTGEGWQMWETTSEGSPISPVFETAEALADWLAANGTSVFRGRTASRDEWLRIITGEQFGVEFAPGCIAI
jgi:hypothetical protein